MSRPDYYAILGVPKTASDEDLKKAYRKHSSAHHPDKHTTATPEEKATHEAKFKEAKEAYEFLTDPQKRDFYDRGGDPTEPQHSGWRKAAPSEMDEILEQLRRARGGGFNQASFKQVTEFQAGVTLKEAFEGYSVQVQLRDGSIKELKVPGGTPDGYRYQVDVTPSLAAIIVTRIHDDVFRTKSASECGWHTEVVNGRQTVVIETGDIETTAKVDAIDIMLGTWTSITGLEGEKLQVRVPAGFDPSQRLKVKGKGYYHWMHELKKPGQRGDLYVRVEPVFQPVKSINVEKAKALYEQVQGIGEVKPDGA